MTLADRIHALVASTAETGALVLEVTRPRVRDLAPWMPADALALWLRLADQFSADERIDPHESDMLMRAIRNAVRFRRAGVPAGSRFPREELHRLRWLRWAARHGVPLCTPMWSGRAQPVRAAPWMYRERLLAWAHRADVSTFIAPDGRSWPVRLPDRDTDIMTTA